MAQPEKGQSGKEDERLPHPPSKQAEHPTDDESPEEIREGSQTAQDREHTNRGGDDQTAPMKEFPS
jgi:hypothetical protein